MAEEIQNGQRIEKTEGQVKINEFEKRRRIENAIDNDPYLGVLKRVLNDREFCGISGINKESIIDSYISYDNNINNPIDTDYIMLNTINIIKQVSENPNGYVYNLDGTKNEKLSIAQQREYGIGEYAKIQQVEKAMKDNLYNLIKEGKIDKVIEKDFSITKTILTYDQKREAASDNFIKENEQKTIYTHMKSSEDVKIVALSYIARMEGFKSSGRELDNMECKVLGLKKGTVLKQEDILAMLERQKDSKYYKDILSDDGKLSIKNLIKFGESWEKQRNDQSTEDKLLQFKNSKCENIKNLDLEGKQKVLGYLYRGINTGNEETIKIAKEVALKLKIEIFTEKIDNSKEQDLDNLKISDKKVENYLSGLAPQALRTEQSRRIFLEYCKGYGLNNPDNVFKKLNKTQKWIKAHGKEFDGKEETGASIKEQRKVAQYYQNWVGIAKKTYKEFKNRNKNEDTKKVNHVNKVPKAIAKAGDRIILKNLQKIDFGIEENQEKLIRYFATLKGIDAEVVKKFIIENPQDFGRVINNGNEINKNQIKQVIKETKGLDYSDIEAKIKIKETRSKMERRCGELGPAIKKMTAKRNKKTPKFTKENKVKETAEKKLVEEVANKMKFATKDADVVTFVASYAELKKEIENPNISEKEKEVNKKICNEMLKIMKGPNNKKYFDIYMKGQEDHSVQAIEDEKNNLLSANNEITKNEVLKGIEEFKEKEYGVKRNLQEIEKNDKTEELDRKEDKKSIIETIGDRVKSMFTRKNKEKSENGIGNAVASIVEQGKNIVDKLGDTLQKMLGGKVDPKWLSVGMEIPENLTQATVGLGARNLNVRENRVDNIFAAENYGDGSMTTEDLRNSTDRISKGASIEIDHSKGAVQVTESMEEQLIGE